MTNKEWQGTTYGNGWMHHWLIVGLRYIDVRVLYIFVAIFVVPVCLLFNSSSGVIYRYFRQRIGYGRLRACWKTYVNHCFFSQVVIDKFASYAEKKFQIELEGYEYFADLASRPEGFVQLSSHFGNYELAGYSLVAKDKRFNALVFAGEKESVMANRNKCFAATNIQMIAIKSDMSHVFLIDAALQRGETVSIPADRMNGSRRNVVLPFLGALAEFPQGPFSIATMRELNVLSVSVVKVASKKYHIRVKPLQYDKNASRQEQIQQLAGAYVNELEYNVRRYPEQWYNFFEFWK